MVCMFLPTCLFKCPGLVVVAYDPSPSLSLGSASCILHVVLMTPPSRHCRICGRTSCRTSSKTRRTSFILRCDPQEKAALWGWRLSYENPRSPFAPLNLVDIHPIVVSKSSPRCMGHVSPGILCDARCDGPRGSCGRGLAITLPEPSHISLWLPHSILARKTYLRNTFHTTSKCQGCGLGPYEGMMTT